MGLIKIKKTDRNAERVKKLIKEVTKEDKKSLYIQLDKSVYRKLKKVVFKEETTCTKWIADRIKEYDI